MIIFVYLSRKLTCAKWLQSSQIALVFDSFLIRYSPAFLQGLTPLVALSVCAAVTTGLETNITERLNWLETILTSFDPRVCEILISCSVIANLRIGS